jgi:AcrR family transcriptional regulator
MYATVQSDFAPHSRKGMSAAALTRGQLPSGRHNLSPQAVESDQRRRMLAAMAAALEEHGYARATVAHVLEAARVSRRTFYEQFADKDDCLLAAYEEAEARIWDEASAAAAAVPAADWPGQVKAALTEVLDFCAGEPTTARLFTLEARAALPEIATRQRRALERIAAGLRKGNGASRSQAGLPEGTEATLVANVAALVGAYVLSGATELLPGFASQLGDHLLQPYRDGEAREGPQAAAAPRGPR